MNGFLDGFSVEDVALYEKNLYNYYIDSVFYLPLQYHLINNTSDYVIILLEFFLTKFNTVFAKIIADKA
tara:strand:+ start:99 stop:305 length:207 start_codon:yes stop_codon:yes gene_type:complete